MRKKKLVGILVNKNEIYSKQMYYLNSNIRVDDSRFLDNLFTV